MTTMETPHPQDKVVILRRLPVFASCTEEQLKLIAERTRLVEYKKGEYIYREGDRAEAFYLVASGRLRVFSTINGEERVYAILHNGDSFGEISLLTGETHSATVQAINDTLIVTLEKDDFDDVMNRIPSLVLFLSRLLSKRLRTKNQGGGVAEATVVAIYSAVAGVGRTMFAVALAATLQRETRQDVVLIDMSRGESDRGRFLLESAQASRARFTEGFPPDLFDQEPVAHPLGFDLLSADMLVVEEQREQLVAPLINAMTNRYRYVLIDLPLEVDPSVLKALTQSDLVYLVTDSTKESFIRTNALLHRIQEAVSPLEHRVKVILNLMESQGERLNPAEASQQLNQPIAYILPHVPAPAPLTTEELARLLASRQSPYAATVRRVTRELGGVLVGLALGSGAALGLAHIGVLKVIEREKIPIDLVAGSSIGSLIAALWATGWSADDLEQLAKRYQQRWKVRALFLDFGIPLFSVFVGLVAGVVIWKFSGLLAGLLFWLIVTVSVGVVFGPLAGGPLQGTRVTEVLKLVLGEKTFEDTWLPLKIIAANPMAREEVVFESGRLVDAVRASISIPGIFKPVSYLGKVCLDGGVANPVPVSVLKRAGAKRIIAVNVFPLTSELRTYTEEVQRKRALREAQLASRSFPVRLFAWLKQELQRSVSPLVFDVIMRSMQSMEYQIAEVACHEADLTLRPTIPGSHWLEFFNAEKFIQRGEEEALRHLPQVKRVAGIPETDALTTTTEPRTILT